MLEILKNSMIWAVIVGCQEWFGSIYRHSMLKRVVGRIGIVLKNSYLGEMPNRYSTHKPLYFTSKFYGNLNRFFEACKKTVNFLFESILHLQFVKCKFVKRSAVVLGIVIAIILGMKDIRLFVSVMAVGSGVIFVLLDYERATFFLTLYAVFDYVFRTRIVTLASVWDELFLIALFCVWMFKWVTNKKEKALKVSPFDGCILVFIGIMMFIMLISPDFPIAFEGFRVNVQSMFWFFFVFQLLKDKGGIKKISVVFTVLVGILSIHGVYQYIIDVEMPSTWISSTEVGIRTRVYSIFTSPNIFGSLIVLAFPICISLIVVSKKMKQKLLFGTLLMFMAASLVFTYSRGAWIGAACAIGIYVLLKDKRMIVPALIGGILVLVLIPGIGERLMYMLSPEYMASSMKGGRLIRWITGVHILQEHPWFGLGLGNFGGAVAANHGLSAVVQGQVVPTFYMDNYYMKIAAEAGLVGVTAFIWLMWQVFSISLKTVKIVKDRASKELGIGILAGLLGVIIHCCVENVFEVPMMGSMFWMFVAVMAQLWYSNYKKVD